MAEYKYEIERLQAEMGDVKRKYFEQKKQQQTGELTRLPLLKQVGAAQEGLLPMTHLM